MSSVGSDHGDPDADATRTGIGTSQVWPQGHRVADRYRVVDVAGVGGMGLVYHAHDEHLDLPVALKVLRSGLDPDATADIQQRFRQEIRLARQVTHGNVVRIHDLGQDGDTIYLTMDLVEGRSLQAMIAEEAPLTPARASMLARDIAAGLGAIHAQGIVHRDLKPANVLVRPDGSACITDFGVALHAEDSRLTRTGHIVGTPDFLAPEQVTGATVDQRTDLYALGLILFEMLTGDRPFKSATLDETLAQRAGGSPQPIKRLRPDLPPALLATVNACLQRDPAARPQDAQAVLRLLAGATARVGRQHHLVPAALVLAGLALALGLLLAVLLPAVRSGPAITAAADSDAVEGMVVPRSAPVARVLVAPFADETGDPALAWLATGLPDLVATGLEEHPDLALIAGSEVDQSIKDLHLQALTGEAPDLRRLAELYGASHLVTGHVRRSGDVLRIDARVLDLVTPDAAAAALVAQVENPGQLAGLVQQLVQQVAQQLAAPRAEHASTGLSDDPAALAAYAQGNRHLAAGDAITAEPELEAAVAADPGFAAAWMQLAEARWQTGADSGALAAASEATRLLAGAKGRLPLVAGARMALYSGDLELAGNRLRALLERYPNDRALRQTVAEHLGDLGRLTEATALLEEQTRRDPGNARAWYLLGKFAILGGDPARAADDYLLRAQTLHRRRGNAQGVADSLNALGIALRHLGNIEQAEVHFQDAAALRRDIGDTRGVAASLINLATTRAMAGDHAAAEAALLEASDLFQQLGDQDGIAMTMNERGVLAEERGAYPDALEHYQNALRVRGRQGDQRALAESSNNVGFTYYLLGQLDNAAVYAQRALDLYQQLTNDEGRMQSLQSLAQVLLAQGRSDRALRAYKESLDIARALDAGYAGAVAEGGLGRTAMQQQRFPAAREHLQAALAVVTEAGDPRGELEYTLALVDLFLAMDDVPSAVAAMTGVSALLAAGSNIAQVAEARRLEAELAMARGDPAQAAELAAAAVALAATSGSRPQALRSALTAARVALVAGDAGAAAAAGQVARDAEMAGFMPLAERAQRLAVAANATAVTSAGTKEP